MNKRSKTIALTLASLLVGSMLVGCGGGTSADSSGEAAETRILKFGHVNGESHPCNIAAEKMAEIIKEKTDGRYQIDVYASSALGNERDLIESVQMGSVDFCYTAGTPLGNYVPDMLVTDLPFLIRDFDHADKVYYGEIGQQLMESVDQEGFKTLTFVDIGFRNMAIATKPIQSVSDINGIKIRTMENPLHLEAWRALGADPLPMAWGDAFTALQQGAIDAVEMTNTHMISNGVVDVMKYYAETHHVYTPGLFLMSTNLWESLSEEDQVIFQEAAEEAALLNNELNRKLDEENKAIIEEADIEMYTVDPEEMQASVQSVYDNHQELSEMAEKIKAVK